MQADIGTQQYQISSTWKTEWECIKKANKIGPFHLTAINIDRNAAILYGVAFIS